MIDAVLFIVQQLEAVLPSIGQEDQLIRRSHNGTTIPLKILKHYDGDLVCYRRIDRVGSGICRVRAQRQISILDREEVVYEVPDLLGTPTPGSLPGYSITSTLDPKWNPFVILPEKLTQNFTGRNDELDELKDWYDDIESRACILYGDGGIGKTTLAIEFIYRVLLGDIQVNWHPEVITFLSAKQTKWGIRGLEKLQARVATLDDIPRSIFRAFEQKPLEREWFKLTPEEAIIKLSGYLSENGLKRNDHLIILDNTETLISTDEDIKKLGKFINTLYRHAGRVMLTSRRREAIEARHLEIKPLSDAESASLLKSRAKLLNIKPVLQAGDANLKAYSNKLGNRPLVLEVFLEALGKPGSSLKTAFKLVTRMHQEELGDFLFEDAWERMTPQMQQLLLLMTRLGDVHDELMLKFCCIEVGLTVINATEALQESRGIANITHISGHLQVTLSQHFINFASEKTISVNGQQFPTDAAVEKVLNRYNTYIKSASIYVHDRMAKAFRHQFARAAYQAYKNEDYALCEYYYGEAIEFDPENGWLFDRYAHFLFSRRRYKEALEQAKRAIHLLPKDPEVWFTRGLIEGRLVESGETSITDAVNSLNYAKALGKEEHLCLLYIAYAYFNEKRPNKPLIRKILQESEEATPNDDPLSWKHRDSIETLRRKLSQ